MIMCTGTCSNNSSPNVKFNYSNGYWWIWNNQTAQYDMSSCRWLYKTFFSYFTISYKLSKYISCCNLKLLYHWNVHSSLIECFRFESLPVILVLTCFLVQIWFLHRVAACPTRHSLPNSLHLCSWQYPNEARSSPEAVL